jgi:hypothetical protein
LAPGPQSRKTHLFPPSQVRKNIEGHLGLPGHVGLDPAHAELLRGGKLIFPRKLPLLEKPSPKPSKRTQVPQQARAVAIMPNDLDQATAAALKRRDHPRADPASNSPEPDAQGSATYDNRTHSSSFRQIKKKAVQFKCGRPLPDKRHGGSKPIRGERLSLSETQSCWQLISNRAMLLPERAPRYLIRDRDGAYGEVFIRRLRSIGIRDRPTSPRSPWQNGYAERLIGSVRRECLDHVVVFSERHLRHLLLCYMKYYNGARTHLSLEKDAPVSRAVDRAGHILCRPTLGGLHHQYARI